MQFPSLTPAEIGIASLLIALCVALGTVRGTGSLDDGILVGSVVFMLFATALSFISGGGLDTVATFITIAVATIAVIIAKSKVNV